MSNSEENDLYTTIRRSVLGDLAAIAKKHKVAISINIYPNYGDDGDGGEADPEPEPQNTVEINVP